MGNSDSSQARKAISNIDLSKLPNSVDADILEVLGVAVQMRATARHSPEFFKFHRRFAQTCIAASGAVKGSRFAEASTIFQVLKNEAKLFSDHLVAEQKVALANYDRSGTLTEIDSKLAECKHILQLEFDGAEDANAHEAVLAKLKERHCSETEKRQSELLALFDSSSYPVMNRRSLKETWGTHSQRRKAMFVEIKELERKCVVRRDFVSALKASDFSNSLRAAARKSRRGPILASLKQKSERAFLLLPQVCAAHDALLSSSRGCRADDAEGIRAISGAGISSIKDKIEETAKSLRICWESLTKELVKDQGLSSYTKDFISELFGSSLEFFFWSADGTSFSPDCPIPRTMDRSILRLGDKEYSTLVETFKSRQLTVKELFENRELERGRAEIKSACEFLRQSLEALSHDRSAFIAARVYGRAVAVAQVHVELLVASERDRSLWGVFKGKYVIPKLPKGMVAKCKMTWRAGLVGGSSDKAEQISKQLASPDLVKSFSIGILDTSGSNVISKKSSDVFSDLMKSIDSVKCSDASVVEEVKVCAEEEVRNEEEVSTDTAGGNDRELQTQNDALGIGNVLDAHFAGKALVADSVHEREDGQQTDELL